MATDWQYKLTGNYYIAWLSRCDDAWRWLLSDRGPYTPMHVLKKQHHADCQRIAKEMLLTQLADKMQRKKLGIKSNRRRSNPVYKVKTRRSKRGGNWIGLDVIGPSGRVYTPFGVFRNSDRGGTYYQSDTTGRTFSTLTEAKAYAQQIATNEQWQNPRRYRRNVRHGHHRHHSALSKRGLMTKRERRRFTKRMKRHHRALRLKYREKWGRGAGH